MKTDDHGPTETEGSFPAASVDSRCELRTETASFSSEFAALLERFGPDSPSVPMSTEEARRFAWRLATTHYENFPVVTLLLPKSVRQHFANVYSFCRWSDDLADEVGSPERSLGLLAWWRSQLEACYEGRASHPIYVALAETIERHQIPIQLFSDLIDAFERDQRCSRYIDFADLRSYCRCSADPVGRIVLHLADAWCEENAILSDYICTGLQLVNFWQDVGLDVDKGRIYLPADDRRRFAVDECDILAKRHSLEFEELLRFEVERARHFLETGLPLARIMPKGFRTPIAMFAEGGLQICRKLDRIRYNVFAKRPRLGKFDGPSIVLRAWFRPWFELLRD